VSKKEYESLILSQETNNKDLVIKSSQKKSVQKENLLSDKEMKEYKLALMKIKNNKPKPIKEEEGSMTHVLKNEKDEQK